MRGGMRVLALMVGLALLDGWGIAHVGRTEAAWVDKEVGSTKLTATTIPKPVIQSCVLAPGTAGLNPVVTMTWNFPAGTSYTTPGNVAYAVAQGGLLPNLTTALLGQGVSTSGPVAGTYTTTFSASLLGGLLGGSYGLYLQTVDPTGWRSALAGATASMGALGVNPTCSPNPV